MYRHDYSGSAYSSLAQINTKNVSSLRDAWSYRLPADANSQATPIVVNGSMFLPAGDRIVALEPETGAERWRRVVADAVPSRRGVAYWSGDGGAPRIILMAGRRLIALDATTGNTATEFGKNGEVDIVVPYNSVPLVYRNIVVVGANNPPRSGGAPGNARAFDARTGAKLWEFSSVAQPGSPGHDTWAGDSWKGRFGANAWPFYFTLDEERGLLYLPLASPIPGGYGGDRAGANLYGNSVVAVDVRTGAYKWHFQTIHHDLWDADPPAPPGLIDIVRNGRRVPAMALTTKSGYVYILNRETGQPIFGVEERPVPKSDVPGEVTFPTQPIPVKPPPLARVAYQAADLVSTTDTTPEHAAACKALIEKTAASTTPAHLRRGNIRERKTPGRSRWCFQAGWAVRTGEGQLQIQRRAMCSSPRRMSAHSDSFERLERALRFRTRKPRPGAGRSTWRSATRIGRARSRRGARSLP